jgi:hypothetical protein
MSLYTLAFREDQGCPCEYGSQDRLDAAAELMSTIGAGDAEAVVALPAGFAGAESLRQRDRWAEGLERVSRDAGVAVVCGIDVDERGRWGLEGCPRSFAYAIDRGRRLLWDAAPTTRPATLRERTIGLAGLRLTVLFGRELFGARTAPIVEAARPELVLVLGHGGPTQRWQAPLLALDELAPTLVVHQALEVRRPIQLPAPRGWRSTSSRGAIRVVCYRREPMAPAQPSWDTERP